MLLETLAGDVVATVTAMDMVTDTVVTVMAVENEEEREGREPSFEENVQYFVKF